MAAYFYLFDVSFSMLPFFIVCVDVLLCQARAAVGHMQSLVGSSSPVRAKGGLKHAGPATPKKATALGGTPDKDGSGGVGTRGADASSGNGALGAKGNESSGVGGGKVIKTPGSPAGVGKDISAGVPGGPVSPASNSGSNNLSSGVDGGTSSHASPRDCSFVQLGDAEV